MAMTVSDFAIEHGVVGFFDEPITLKSGRKSSFYVNWRHVTSDAYLLDQISDLVAREIQKLAWPASTILGVPEGGSKLAIMVNMKLARQSSHFAPGSHQVPMMRAKPKEHGKPEDRLFLGQPRGPVIVLEDTITSGLSLLQCLDQLQSAQVELVGVVSLTDRMEKTAEGCDLQTSLKTHHPGLQYQSLSNARELLPAACHKLRPSELIRTSVAAEYEEHGCVSIKL